MENRLKDLLVDSRKIKTLTGRFNSFQEAKADKFLKALFQNDLVLSYLIKEEHASGSSPYIEFSYTFYVVTPTQFYVVHHIEQEIDGNDLNLECQNHFFRYSLSDIKGISCKHKPLRNDVKHEIKVSFFHDCCDFTFHVNELEGYKACYNYSKDFSDLLNFISDLNFAIGQADCAGATLLQKQEQPHKEYVMDFVMTSRLA